jgi:rare lipoprotein A (peptidoglycan hydrolase)
MLVASRYTPVAVCTFLMLGSSAVHAGPPGDLASFYTTGRITANGERFDKAALKAAHPSLPFGSIVRVVNRRNGRSVIVEINDRGPAKWTRRSIDLTHGAARVIGMVKRGVVPVRLEVAQVTRPQLDRAFVKLVRLIDARQVVAAAHAEVTAEPQARHDQLAGAVTTEITRPPALVADSPPHQRGRMGAPDWRGDRKLARQPQPRLQHRRYARA